MSIGITSASLGYSRSASDLRYLGKTGVQTLSGGLDINESSLAGSGSLSGSALDIAQTWNTTGTPTAIKLNVTDTASNASSLLMDLQVGGVSRLSISKNGSVRADASFVTKSGVGQIYESTNSVRFNAGGGGAADRTVFQAPRWNLASTGNSGELVLMNQGNGGPSRIVFGPSLTTWGSITTDGTNNISLHNGNNSQELRLYNTYTNASNYERLSLKANTGGPPGLANPGGAFEIKSEAAGTGVVRNISLGGTNPITISSAGNLTIPLTLTTGAGGGIGIRFGSSSGFGTGYNKLAMVPETGGVYIGPSYNINTSNFLSRFSWNFLDTGTQSKMAVGLDTDFSATIQCLSSFKIVNNSVASIFASDTNNVGIGTTAPSAKLSILDTALAGSAALSGSALDIAQTWNTTGTPTAIKLNVTDTASNASSLLMDLQVGGNRHFSVRKDGRIDFVTGGSENNGLFFIRNSIHNWTWGSNGVGDIANINGNIVDFKQNLIASRQGIVIKDMGQTTGAWLLGEAADTLAQRRSTSPQELRLYNTYTNASNYERLSFKANTGGSYTITSQAAGTGTNRSLNISIGSERTVEISNTTMTVDKAFTFSTPNTYFFKIGNTAYETYWGKGFRFTDNDHLTWCSTANPAYNAIPDIGIARTASGVLRLKTYSAVGPLTESGDGSLILNNLTASGDIEAETIGNGVILKSPNGTRYRITVDNTGALITTALP